MRRAIRVGIPAAAICAAVIGIFLPVPDSLPDVALGNRELLWLERTLVFFYGFLLLFVPLFRALEASCRSSSPREALATRRLRTPPSKD